MQEDQKSEPNGQFGEYSLKTRLFRFRITLELEMLYELFRMGWVGSTSWARPWASSWPGGVIPSPGKPRARQRWTESPRGGQESHFHISANFSEICAKMLLLGCGGLGWLGMPGAQTGQERSALGQGKPRARQRWTESPGRGQETSERRISLCSKIRSKMLLLGCARIAWLGRPWD